MLRICQGVFENLCKNILVGLKICNYARKHASGMGFKFGFIVPINPSEMLASECEIRFACEICPYGHVMVQNLRFCPL